MAETIGLFSPVRFQADFKTLRLDEPGTVKYIGLAAIGSAENSAVWQIRRLTDEPPNLKVEWADGNAEFDNVWANRESLNYS
jgi:hypothetical protein